MLDDVHSRARHAGSDGDEVLDQAQREGFDLVDRTLLGQRVDGVAHRVGRQQSGVVPIDVGGLELALQRDVDAQVD